MAPSHMAKRGVMLARWYASPCLNETDHYPVLDIRLTDAERRQGERLIRDIVVASGQSNTGGVIGRFAEATGNKRYGQAWWNDFVCALKLASPDCCIVEIIPVHGRSMLDSKWPGYYSTSIRRMASAMAGVDMMISADCGAMHLAVAAGTPTVGMFSVADARIYGPYGSHNAHLVTQAMTAQQVAKRAVELYRESFGASADFSTNHRLEATLL
jgi:heptosyltransferase-3